MDVLPLVVCIYLALSTAYAAAVTCKGDTLDEYPMLREFLENKMEERKLENSKEQEPENEDRALSSHGPSKTVVLDEGDFSFYFVVRIVEGTHTLGKIVKFDLIENECLEVPLSSVCIYFLEKDAFGKNSNREDAFGKNSFREDAFGEDASREDEFGEDAFGEDAFGAEPNLKRTGLKIVLVDIKVSKIYVQKYGSDVGSGEYRQLIPIQKVPDAPPSGNASTLQSKQSNEIFWMVPHSEVVKKFVTNTARQSEHEVVLRESVVPLMTNQQSQSAYRLMAFVEKHTRLTAEEDKPQFQFPSSGFDSIPEEIDLKYAYRTPAPARRRGFQSRAVRFQRDSESDGESHRSPLTSLLSIFSRSGRPRRSAGCRDITSSVPSSRLAAIDGAAFRKEKKAGGRR